MLWIPLSILAGFFVALSDALNKKHFGEAGFINMTLARTLGVVPFLLPPLIYFLFFENKISYLTLEFLLNTLILLSLEILATLFYMRGIQISPLSVSLPFLSFTPIFIILTGYLILNERVSSAGTVGILLIAVGGYLVHLPRINQGFFGPLKGIWEERGSLYLLITALIYSITSVLGKRGILLSDPLFFALFYFSIFSIMTPLVIMVFRGVKTGFTLLKKRREILLVGGTQALMCLFHMWALSLVETAYMIALKRTSIIFSVILGWVLFRESHIRLRLSAVILMFLGILIITFLK